jgi:hypothetical protein
MFTVQIDIDGTITRMPGFYKWLTESLRRDGHSVLIASSRTTSPENDKITAKELAEMGVVYDKMILSPELNNLDKSRLPADMNPGESLYVYKLIVAQDEKTTILIDDCGVTAGLFQRHLPNVEILLPLQGNLSPKRTV